MPSSKPIAFFDSGLGGISVLREAVRLMPNENYLYYGDSLHAPYGAKSAAEVLNLCRNAAEYLTGIGIKALVIACNTATSAAANDLRAKYPDLLIIGTEPAIKPAALEHPGGRILVMATAMTLQEQKFHDLWESLGDTAQIEQKVKGRITGTELGTASQHSGNSIALAELDHGILFDRTDAL